MSWKEELKKEVELADDEATLDNYSKDASIFQIKPEVVIFPKNSNEVIETVKLIKKNKKKNPSLSISARSAGTDMTGGPLTESIVMDFTKYFNKINGIENNSVIVQPGVFFRDLEEKTFEKYLLFPTYPASKSICAVGGMIANNSGGEKSTKYGKTADHVLSLKMVLSDGKEYEFKKLDKKELNKKLRKKDFEGQIYRKLYKLIDKNYELIQKNKPIVSKNSAGYYLWDVYDKNNFDLTRLFTGSQGTLGIITEAKLELVKKYKHSRLVVCFLKDTESLAKFVNVILPLDPESLETFDDKTLKLSMKFMGEIGKKIGKSKLSMFWSFRKEAFVSLLHGFPKYVILVEMVDDDENALSEKIRKVHEEVKKNKIPNLVMKSEEAGKKYWTMRRESFNLLRHKIKDKQATAFIDDFIINPESLPEFIPKLEAILKEHKIDLTLLGHAGSGNFHIIPLMDLSKEEERAKIPVVSEKVYDLVREYKGSITAEHNDGLIRTPYLGKMFTPEMLKLFEEVKKILDPLDIFNPGKKVNGNMDYAMRHVKRD